MHSAIEKAQHVRLLILDVDGVLTSGTLTYSMNGEEMKRFHIHDGLGIKLLQKAGIQVAIISGKSSGAVKKRLEELGVSLAYLGQEDKLPAYEALKNSLQLEDKEIAYMGDDLPDLPLLRRVGLAMSVPQATDLIQQHAHFITARKAGKGAVREACEFILEAQGRYQSVLETYLK